MFIFFLSSRCILQLYSRVGRRKLVLRHYIAHWAVCPNFWVNSGVQRENEINNKFSGVGRRLFWDGPGPPSYLYFYAQGNSMYFKKCTMILLQCKLFFKFKYFIPASRNRTHNRRVYLMLHFFVFLNIKGFGTIFYFMFSIVMSIRLIA